MEARLVLPDLREGRVGEGSLDCAGDAVTEVDAEVHLDCCESMCALEVADVSLSAEFRLDRLASMTTGLSAMLVVGWLLSIQGVSESAQTMEPRLRGTCHNFGISSEG